MFSTAFYFLFIWFFLYSTEKLLHYLLSVAWFPLNRHYKETQRVKKASWNDWHQAWVFEREAHSKNKKLLCAELLITNGVVYRLNWYSGQVSNQFQVINHEMNSRGIKQVFDITFSLLELRSPSGLLFIYFVWYTLREFFANIHHNITLFYSICRVQLFS